MLKAAFQNINRHAANAAVVTGTAAATAALVVSMPGKEQYVAKCEDDEVLPPQYPWRHRGWFSSFDHAALRRGFQVYTEVCATCHSLEFIKFRHLVGVTHTADQVKAMAKQIDVVDGPNRDGEMFERPGKPIDGLPKPYENEQQGAAANNGAYPPDLSLMVKARHSGHDYIFALLTGYMDPPVGKELMDGVYYNPYFHGGGIAMPPPLQDDGIEYTDGTIATIAQQARDVVQFLNWCAEPEYEARRKNAAYWIFSIAFMALGAGYAKRVGWSNLKTRRIAYVKNL